MIASVMKFAHLDLNPTFIIYNQITTLFRFKNSILHSWKLLENILLKLDEFLIFSFYTSECICLEGLTKVLEGAEP